MRIVWTVAHYFSLCLRATRILTGRAMLVRKPTSNTKRRHQKVSTRCDNCKKRRIKCDETKPACRQCQKLGCVCLGYHPPRARIFEPLHNSPPNLRTTPIRQSDAISMLPHSDIGTLTTITKAPNNRSIWQKALLDVFLTQWLPSSLARKQEVLQYNSHVVSMSGWPAVAWKLGTDTDDNIVARSLLCLVLCLLGSQTGNSNLVEEAAHHYEKLLSVFQHQVHRFARLGYASCEDREIASLIAVGYSCAQIEYILGSWGNADRHLDGVATIFQVCGPSCLHSEDTLRIFLDHCLLWISCAVVHQRDTIYSRVQWHFDWTTTATCCPSCQSVLELLAIASRLPLLLKKYYTVPTQLDSSPEIVEYMRQFSNIVAAVEAISVSVERSQKPEDSSDGQSEITNSQSSHHVLGNTLIVGYSSAFVLHALLAMYRIAKTLDVATAKTALENTAHKPYDLQARCEMHATKICRIVDRFLNEDIGIMMVNPCLFFVDSAWLAYDVIGKASSQDSANTKAWFSQVGDRMRKRGFQPLREPWLTAWTTQAGVASL